MSKLNGLYLINYLGLVLLAGFYVLAGINHFRDPEFYYPLIPPYLPNHGLINIAAGIIETIVIELVNDGTNIFSCQSTGTRSDQDSDFSGP